MKQAIRVALWGWAVGTLIANATPGVYTDTSTTSGAPDITIGTAIRDDGCAPEGLSCYHHMRMRTPARHRAASPIALPLAVQGAQIGLLSFLAANPTSTRVIGTPKSQSPDGPWAPPWMFWL